MQTQVAQEQDTPNRITRIAGQIGVHGDLVVANRLELKKEAFDAMAEGATSLVIRFDGQERYIDSSGISALMSIAKYGHERHVTVTLAGLTAEQKAHLELVKVAQYFQFEA